MLVSLALTAAAFTGALAGAAPGSGVLEGSGSRPGDDAPAAAPTRTSCNVTFTSRDGLHLAGSFWAPKSSKEKAPGALLVHSAGSDRASVEELGDYLNKKGFAVLSVDLRGHGNSVSENANWARSDEKGRESLWALASRDVEAAASFLLQHGNVHSTNLSVVGVGSGCVLALRHAHGDQNSRAVVLVSPEAASFGYNLVQGVAELAGLPTLLISSNKSKEIAERIKSNGHELNGGLVYIEVALVRSEPESVLSDSKLGSSAANWLRTQVMPKK